MSIRPASDGATTRPAPHDLEPGELLLVGDAHGRETLMLALDHWASRSLGVDDVAAAIRRTSTATAAVLLLAGNDARPQLKKLLAGIAAHDRPVLLLVAPESLGEDEAADLYDVGAAAVLAWPAEAPLLPRLIDELLAGIDGASAGTDGASESADTPLEQAVCARLTADTVLGTMGVRVLGGTAVLHGAVASAWERARLRRLVETVPGIARVVDHGVAVHGAEIADDELRTVVDATLRSVGNAEARELEVDIHAAIATLRGVASSRDVASRVCNAIRRIPGIRRAYDASVGTES